MAVVTEAVDRPDFRSKCQQYCSMDGCGNRYCSEHPDNFHKKRQRRPRFNKKPRVQDMEVMS